MASEGGAPFQQWIEQTCGSSIRLALLMAQNLFRVPPTLMQNDRVSGYAAVRACVTQGREQLSYGPRSIVEHLFQVNGAPGASILLKLRLLRYLAHGERRSRHLADVCTTLRTFGYDETSIAKALDDLMRSECQIVVSNGFDRYRDAEALQRYSGHEIWLTRIGEGYATQVVANVEYLQEVALDTHVDPEHFPSRLRHRHLSDRLEVLYLFLKELRSIDVAETTRMVDRWGATSYIDALGSRLITLDIIQAAYLAADRILAAATDHHPQHRGAFEQVHDDLKSLVLQTEQDNNNVLGVWPRSAVSKVRPHERAAATVDQREQHRHALPPPSPRRSARRRLSPGDPA